MLTRNLQNFLSLFGISFVAMASSYYAFYPMMQEKKLLRLLKKLDEEKKYEEMKEIIKSPYLKHHTFVFKDDAAISNDANDCKTITAA